MGKGNPQLSVRLTPAVFDSVRKMAASEGKSTAEYVRELLESKVAEKNTQATA